MKHIFIFILLLLPLNVFAQDSTAFNDTVEEKNLGEVSFDGVGLIGVKEGGFATNMWQGSDGAFIGVLLDKLPQTQSIEINVIKKRLLISIADRPENLSGKDSLFFTRLQQLAYIGASTEIANILRKIPDAYKNERMDAIYVISLFSAQNYADGCETAQNEFRKYNNMYWRKIILACHADSGKKSELDLGLKLLKEDKKTLDDAFKKILTQLQSKDKTARKDFLKNISAEIFPSKQLQQPLPQIKEKYTTISLDNLNNLVSKISSTEDSSKKIAIIARLYALLESLGEKIPEKEWQQIATYSLANNIKVPSFVWISLLQNAVNDKRQGEIALLVIHLIGEEQLAALTPELLRWAIYSADEMGFKKDAQKILIEAMEIK